MKTTKLTIFDEVNCKFEGLDSSTKRQCNDKLRFFIHAARHTPAFKLGRWDGYKSFFALNGSTYLNLIDRIIDIIVNNGYEIEIEDLRQHHDLAFSTIDENFIFENAPNPTWPEGHPVEGEPILLRDYQVEAINHYIQNPQSIATISTGGGKTIIAASLSLLCQSKGRTIIVVPNRSLVNQTYEDYKNIGLDVGRYFGGMKEVEHQHIISTWQSLDIINPTSKKKYKAEDMERVEYERKMLTENVVAIIVDETHTAAANVLQNILSGPLAHTPIRWGMTGTMPEEDHNVVAIESVIGKNVYTLKAKELMDKKVLSNLQIDILRMRDEESFDTFHDEYEYLVTDEVRLDWMSEFIKKTSKTGNTLVLINRISTGEELLERIPEASLVYGSVKEKDRKQAYDEINTGDDNIVIATYGVAAVGINIPRIFNLILIEPGKSFIRVIQSIGRGIRKAKDKDFIKVYDIASTCKFSTKHMNARKKFYKEADYPYKEKKIDYMKELTDGL